MEKRLVEWGQPLVVAGSARRGGNTDTAAALVGSILGAKVLRVADLQVSPCMSCGFCDAHPGVCALDNMSGVTAEQDGIVTLLNAIATSPVACFVSPIYFYHLPAQVKAMVDRAQAFWALPQAQKPGQGRALGVVLLAARARGDKLFEGTLATLRIFCDVLGMTLAEPLLLRNLDAPQALSVNIEAQVRITEYAQALRATGCH